MLLLLETCVSLTLYPDFQVGLRDQVVWRLTLVPRGLSRLGKTFNRDILCGYHSRKEGEPQRVRKERYGFLCPAETRETQDLLSVFALEAVAGDQGWSGPQESLTPFSHSLPYAVQ